ncbi:hypothetical protein [Flavicella marina]|uniref:hypothetical protein n=1 Tax=Flavicella marina TaxID=1475951 RepID=UPI0012642220|nr:hypothetical protein [Flavicella marina]
MKKKYFAFVFLLSFIYANSQSKFEKGYIIDNKNKKTECLILNQGWSDTPYEIIYKSSEGATEKTLSIDDMKEFSLIGQSKFIRYTGKIERSKKEIDDLTTENKPKFNVETIFLEEVISGTASLYVYRFEEINKFFFSAFETPIEPLVKITYLNTSRTTYKENNMYRQQLFNSLKCDDLKTNRLEWLKYESKDLAKYFEKYNVCINPDYVNENENHMKTKFMDYIHLNILPGVTYNQLRLQNLRYNFNDAGTANEFGYRIGAEIEAVIPYFNYSYSVILEPKYSSFSYKGYFDEASYFSGTYSIFEVSIGLRYKYRANEKSAFFINGNYGFGFPSTQNSDGVSTKLYRDSFFNGVRTENLQYTDNEHKTALGSFEIGLGYKFKEKYSIELRFTAVETDVLNRNLWTGSLARQNLIFGYTLF